MRVYVPGTLAMLEQLHAAGELAAVNGTAFAVTPALRAAYAVGDEEELSYSAMSEAARASLRLLAGELDAEGALARRVVLSADVDDVALRPDLDAAVVRLRRPVQLSEVAAAHVDLAEAEQVVRAAVGVVDEADLGDHDAEFVLGEAEDHELAWYATQELPFLLDLL